MKLYLINIYEAYRADEQGVTAMREVPNNSDYYKYEVLEEADVELPAGFELEKTQGDGTEIFCGNEAAEMVTEWQDDHYVTSLITSKGATVIKVWNC